MRNSLLISTLTLLTSNIIGLALTVSASPNVFTLWISYWSENVAIGIFTILKMRKVARTGREIQSPTSGGTFFIPFFAMHYGIFTLVHGIFLFIFYGLYGADKGSVWVILANVAFLFISHSVSYITNFLGSKEYNHVTTERLFISPYPRVIAMHLVVILGGMVIMNLKSPVIGILLLGVAKICADLIGHLMQHRPKNP